MFGENIPVPVDETEKLKLRHFLVITLEHVWWAMNKKWKENISSNWEATRKVIYRSLGRYWRTSESRKE